MKQKKKKRKLLIIFLTIAIVLSAGFLVFCLTDLIKASQAAAALPVTAEAAESTPEQPVILPQPSEAPTPVPTPTPFPEYDITLMAVGDNLMHMGIVYSGRQDDGTFDYSLLFDGIRDFLNTADIKIINQETILGGNERGFSGYPHFNSPTEVGDAISAAGFNVVLHASNHSADQGLDGLISCARFWESHPEVLVTGIHEDTAGTDEIPLLTIDGVTFAILNYTYGANTETLPLNLLGHLELLCYVDEATGRMDFTTLNPKVITDIQKAKELADVVIVCPHWGTEYVLTPSSYQEQWALEMTAAGADVIIGTHPHVVQPVSRITAPNGNEALCYYSLGNYVSTQKNGASMLEALAFITFHVTENEITIDHGRTGVLPLVCQYTAGPVRLDQVYLLEDYTEDLAAAHGIRSYGGVALTAAELNRLSNETFGEWILTKEQVLIP